ncbi:hypothetical protein ABPG77_000259 [Micractinium sp. CCAP 211/92]
MGGVRSTGATPTHLNIVSTNQLRVSEGSRRQVAAIAASHAGPPSCLGNGQHSDSSVRLGLKEEQAEHEEGPIVLRYESLVRAQLVRRYKRFLGDVRLEAAAAAAVAREPAVAGPAAGGGSGGDGQSLTAGLAPVAAEAGVTTVHVPNTGPMTGLLDALPAPALLSVSADPKRKYKHTLEWLRPDGEQGRWVGTHSAKANAMVRSLLEARLLPGLPSYEWVQAEVRYGADGKSRVDFLLRSGGPDASGSTAKAGVKRRRTRGAAATAAAEAAAGRGRIALFPDTVSERAQRHVRELTALAAAGGDAALVFVVQRADCSAFAPCHEKDPEYGRLVREAAAAGVALLPVVCCLDEAARVVRYKGTLPVDLDYKWKVDS